MSTCQRLGGGAIALDKIICPLYVHCQGGEVVHNVIVSHASWINLGVNNQLEAVREWDRIIQKFWTMNRMLVLPNSIMGSPFVVLFYRGGEVADGPGAPPKVRRRLISTQYTTHRLTTYATSNAHQRLPVFMLTSM